MAFDLTDEQYKKFHEFEEAVIQALSARNELLPELAATKKDRGGVTEDPRDAFKSKLKPANEEKGYAANLRVFVQHNPERPMTKVSKMHLKERPDGTKYITKPVAGASPTCRTTASRWCRSSRSARHLLGRHGRRPQV